MKNNSIDVIKLYENISHHYNTRRHLASNDVTELIAVLKFHGDLKGKLILDIGCGPGKHIAEFVKRGAKITAIDISEEMVKIARNNNPKEKNIYLADVHKINFPEKSYHHINASLSLIYTNKLSQLLKKIYIWLKPRGVFTFSVMHPMYYYRHNPDFDFSKPGLIKFYSPSYDVHFQNQYFPLGVYIEMIKSASFHLETLCETTVPRNIKGWKEEKYRLPNTIIFKLSK